MIQTMRSRAYMAFVAYRMGRKSGVHAMISYLVAAGAAAALVFFCFSENTASA